MSNNQTYIDNIFLQFKQAYQSFKDHPTDSLLEDLCDKMMDYLDIEVIRDLFNTICNEQMAKYPDIISQAIMMYHYIWDEDMSTDDFTDLF